MTTVGCSTGRNNDVGPVSSLVRQERLNRYIDPDDGFPVVTPPFGVAVRREEDNNIGYPFRFYDIVNDTLNSIDYDSYELNKTWRMEPYHYGGILEPLVGVRWMRMDDTNGFQDYLQHGRESAADWPAFTCRRADHDARCDDGERNVRTAAWIPLLQARNRYVFSVGFTAFCGGNCQCSKSLAFSTLTIYDGNTVGSNVIRIIEETSDPIYTRNEEFYVGFDVRAELGYQLTKMIQIRGGFQLIDIARGVWRGGDGTFTPGGSHRSGLPDGRGHVRDQPEPLIAFSELSRAWGKTNGPARFISRGRFVFESRVRKQQDRCLVNDRDYVRAS